MLGERCDFDFTKGAEAFNSFIQEMQIKILTREEEVMKGVIIDYFKEHAKEYNKRISVVLMKEEEVKKIIDLGIDSYLKSER